jgi:hypothetical protein
MCARSVSTWTNSWRRKRSPRLRPHRAQRDRGDRRIRSRRAVHPPGPRDRFHRRETRRARHGRGAVRRPAQSRRAAGRAAPPVPLAEGSRHDRGHHRREGRRQRDHALWPGGIRGRLRDHPGPAHSGPNLHPPPARAEISRHRAWHERIPVPDRRARHSPCCRSRRCNSITRSPPQRVPPASRGSTTCWAAGRLSRQQRARLRLARHRQEQHRRQVRRSRLPARRAGAVFRL